MNVMVWVGIGIVLLAGYVVRIGLRGTAAGTVLQCRKCGYDLRGAPESKRCSECGADLSVAGAVRTKLRCKRPVLLICGIVMLLLGSATITPMARDSVRALLAIENVPQWWLRRSLLSSDSGTCARAADELKRRIVAGEMQQTDGTSLLRMLRDRQQDKALPWSDNLRLLADQALFKGLFTDKPALAAFIDDSIRLAPLPPASGALFATWPIVDIYEYRSFSSHLLAISPEKMDISFDGHHALLTENRFSSYVFGRQQPSGVIHGDRSHISFIKPAPMSYLAMLGPGAHAARMRLKYTVKLDDRDMVSAGIGQDVSGLPAAQQSFEFSGDVIVPQAMANVIEEDDRFLEQLRLRANDSDGGPHVTVNQHRYYPSFDFVGPPPSANFAGVVYLRDENGVQWPIGDVRFERGKPANRMVWASETENTAWKRFDAKRVDVVIESNAFVASYSKMEGPYLTGRREFRDTEVWREDENDNLVPPTPRR